MIKQISEEGWKKAYYEKWLKAQRLTKSKRKWDDHADGGVSSRRIGWKSLTILSRCSYCDETKCPGCSLKAKAVCSGFGYSATFYQYSLEMCKPRTNWKRANELVDEIVEAIRQDGIEWGYINE
jgi:hypothetical protein